jgi:hypothetical protein
MKPGIELVSVGGGRDQAEKEENDGSNSVDESDVSVPAAPGDIGEGPGGGGHPAPGETSSAQSCSTSLFDERRAPADLTPL